MVDYNDINGRITDFDFVVADWGTSGWEEEHFGGTPMYASPNTFQRSEVKDLFAFGRIAAEMYFEKSGNNINQQLTKVNYFYFRLKYGLQSRFSRLKTKMNYLDYADYFRRL